MKLVNLLSSVVVESPLPKKLLKEVSDKIKAKLIGKFSQDTKDDEKTIGGYIDDFEKYKNGLPVEKRDISRYSYSELKNIIALKRTQKRESDLFKEFKKKEGGIENVSLKKTIRKFLEIEEAFGKGKDITKYKFLDLQKVIDQSYPKYLLKILSEKFKKENPNLTEDVIMYYVQAYLDNFNQLYEQMPLATSLSFTDFEHYIDASAKNEDVDTKTDVSDIEEVYNNNNLLIFQPKTRDQCIKLKNGRSWCTSREGTSNLFYNYRLDNERTLYYVIDQDKDYSDVNFAVVILVDPDGDMSLADGTNSGRYSGHNNIPWSEILTKIPKLKGLEGVFKPKPLTSEEKSLIDKIRNSKVGDNPFETFANENEVEYWLEIVNRKVSDEQFNNLTPNLRKKYIALGHELTAGQVRNSDSDTMKYYLKKKVEALSNKSIGNLSEGEIAILNLPMMAKLKESLKVKFATNFVFKDSAVIELPSSNEGKYIALYGLKELFDSLPDTITELVIKNKSKDGAIKIEIPNDIDRFSNLENLSLTGVVEELPESIGNLSRLSVLGLPNNPRLKSLPKSLAKLEELDFILLEGSNPDIIIPEEVRARMKEEGPGFYIWY